MKPPEKERARLGTGRREDLNDGRGYAACHHGATLTEPLSQDGFDIKTHATPERCVKEGHHKPLAKELFHDGFTLRRIARDGDIAIYEETWNGCTNPIVAYEVVRIRRREAREIKGKIIQAAEVYPRPEAWGVDGFTLTDRDAAFAKLRKICR